MPTTDQPALLPGIKRRKTRTKAEADPAVTRLIERHAAKFQRKFNIPLHILWGRNGKEIKTLLAVWPEADIEALQDVFFDSKDARIAKAYCPDYSIAHFARVAQLLRIPAPTGEARTAGNMDAVRRAVQGRRRAIGPKTETT